MASQVKKVEQGKTWTAPQVITVALADAQHFQNHSFDGGPGMHMGFKS